MTTNPLLADWTTPYGLPPFDRITPAHFAPAFEVAMQAQRAEVPADRFQLAQDRLRPLGIELAVVKQGPKGLQAESVTAL